MANQEHLERLKRNIEEWNQWRRDYPEMRPDLSRANFDGAILSGATIGRGTTVFFPDLVRPNIRRANFSGVDLHGADLSGALLSRALLREADLSRAILYGANLRGALLIRANLSLANPTFIRYLLSEKAQREDTQNASWLVTLKSVYKLDVQLLSASMMRLKRVRQRYQM
jgi:uncharacterized protein YjbI with pentapeptide repeats